MVTCNKYKVVLSQHGCRSGNILYVFCSYRATDAYLIFLQTSEAEFLLFINKTWSHIKHAKAVKKENICFVMRMLINHWPDLISFMCGVHMAPLSR